VGDETDEEGGGPEAVDPRYAGVPPVTTRAYIAYAVMVSLVRPFLATGGPRSLDLIPLVVEGLLLWGIWRGWRLTWNIFVLGAIVELAVLVVGVTDVFLPASSGSPWFVALDGVVTLGLLGSRSARAWVWDRHRARRAEMPPVEVAAARARGLIYLIFGLVIAAFLLVVCGTFLAAGQGPGIERPPPFPAGDP
jgi:hypothetical protein